MKINIQSTSDVITNSSTEVYLMLTTNALSTLKDAVTAVIKCIDPSKSFDDYFEVSKDYYGQEYSYGDYLCEYHPKAYDLWWDLDAFKGENFKVSEVTIRIVQEEFDRIIKECNLLSYKDFCNNQEGYVETRFNVTAKQEQFNSAAKALNKINDLFFGESVYDS